MNVDSQLVNTWIFVFVILSAAGFVSGPAWADDGGTCISDIRQVIARKPTQHGDYAALAGP